MSVAVALSSAVLELPEEVESALNLARLDGYRVSREHRPDGSAVATITPGDLARIDEATLEALGDAGWSVRGEQCQWVERPGAWPPLEGVPDVFEPVDGSDSPSPELDGAHCENPSTFQVRGTATFAEQIPKYRGKPGALPPEPHEVPSEASAVPARKWRPLQPVMMGARRWQDETSAELFELGAWKRAESFGGCGRQAYVATCPHEGCGASPARIQLIAACDSRICPYCGRRAAREASAKIIEAIPHVERIQAERAPTRTKQLRGQWERAVRRRDRLAGKVRRLEREHEDSPYTFEQAEKLAKLRTRTNSLREAWRHARDEQTWTWKFATIGVQYDPYDDANYTVEGLRFRVNRAMDAARAAIGALRPTGLEAFTVGGEMSAGGHVHAHILYRGPAIHWKAARAAVMRGLAKGDCRKGVAPILASVKLQEVEPRGGGEYDNGEARREFEYLSAALPRVRKALARAKRNASHADVAKFERRLERMTSARVELLRGAVHEAAKYTVKAPSPLRCEWIGGTRERVIHPKLAARWQVATAHKQLRIPYGVMRDALRIVNAAREVIDATKGGGEHVEHCHECGAELPPNSDRSCWKPWSTFALARAVNDRERWRGLVNIYRPPSTYQPCAKRDWQIPNVNDGAEVDPLDA